MGSYIARNYIARYKSALSGVILTGGNDSPSIQGHFGRFMTTVLALFFGWHHRSDLCTMVTFGSYLKKIQDPISTSDWICRRKEVVRRYDEDPLCGFTFTLNGYHTLATFVERSSRESYYKNISKNIPMLIMSGDEDPVGEYVKGVTRMYERYKKYDNDVTFIIRHGDRHEILNENDREEVYEEIRKFIYKKGNLE
jgi:alpha-beta hydrolase superfamily lysophospholipase